MWNPFRKLSTTDAARLRKLENEMLEVSDTATLCLERITRLDARIRGRARKAAREEEDVAEEIVSQPVLPSSKFTKDQLRAFAQQRGLAPNGRTDA
jgi:hypothetical protein